MAHTSRALADATALNGTPPAYPQIQPLKAALFFDSAKGLGEWRIFMSTTAVKDMRKYLRDKKVFKIILKKLRELSTGFFSDDNQKRLQGPSNGIPIFEAKLTNDLRLIVRHPQNPYNEWAMAHQRSLHSQYQIDMMTDFERNCETQGIRVYGVFTHAQMDNRMWASLSAQLTARGSEYRRRIQFRPRPRANGDKVFLPQSWPDASSVENCTDDASMVAEVDEADRALIHQWLVLEKYSALSMALVNWILLDKDSVPLFSVSPHERTIIEHISSCYVLGRSGTGKTTVMTFKMFGIERAARIRASGLEYTPRQLFVTQSPVLAGRVKEFYVKFSEFLSSAMGVIPDPAAEQEHPDDEGLGDPEDDEDLHDNLPRRFSELQDKHFPLFLTFDKLCKLVEADLGIALARSTSTKEQKRAGRRYRVLDTDANEDFNLIADEDFGFHTAVDSAGPSEETLRSCLVDFESFQNNYWPHFPQDLTHRLDPALVFSEILGVIEGSEEACQSKNMYLSREAYLGLSARTRSMFAGHRERVYLLFEKYMTLKRQYGHYDLADRARAILQKLKEGYQHSVDYLYVDEAQDNLIMDTLLLRRLCCNPHGLFWAGDTAQTIAIGSSFRFDDLKASLYRLEREMYAVAAEKLVEPEFFQLTTNYRSHGGIVNCAGLIVELITSFWPYSIDALQKERGVVDGPKPIFFTGCNDETSRYEQFLLGENGSSVEFGAEQCILVRNDQARKQLRKAVGEIGVILTLYESKGLEFDDVLLYDFFEDSSCSLSQWRVVLNFMPDLQGANSAPRFDELLHAGLCIELKCLYVAITRARKNLWIMDRSTKGEPMKDLLVRHGKVEVRAVENAPRLAKSSTAQQWAKTGELLFNNKRYTQAMQCFDHAGLPIKRDIAEAYYLRHKARNVPRREGEQARIKAYKEAGSAFFDCAGNAFASRKRYYHISAECFREARDNARAALAHENAEEYTDAAKCYAKAILFEDALRIVRENSVDRVTTARIIGAARLHFAHVEAPEKAMTLKLFDCREQLVEYMEDYGFETARAKVLEEDGRIQDAADIYFREGQEDRAICLLLENERSPESLKRAVDHLLTCFWRRYPFGLDPKQLMEKSMDPFQHVQRVINRELPEEIKEEFAMFNAMRRNDRNCLLHAYKFYKERKNAQATLFILDYLLLSEDTIRSMEDAAQYLEACSTYADIVHHIWTCPISAKDPGRTQRLFGFRDEVGDKFALIANCTLATHSTKRKNRSVSHQASDNIVVSHNDLLVIIKSFIKERLRTIVHMQIRRAEQIRDKYFGSLCLDHAVRGQCRQSECHRVHIDVAVADATWFNIRVRIHLLQIIFLHKANLVLTDSELGSMMSKWTISLFKTLNPPLFTMGSSVNVSPGHIPEYTNGIQAVVYWMRDRAYRITTSRASWRFLSSVTEVSSLAFWRYRDRARELLRRVPFYSTQWSFPVDEGKIRYVPISNLIRSLDMLDPEFIKSGFFFIRDVIQFRLAIDLGYLCRIVEVVSAGSVLMYKNRVRGDFHDTLLPRSWLFSSVLILDFDPRHDIRVPTWPLIEYSAELAHHVLVGPGKEHLSGASAAIARFLAVQRIYRAICLVAYNTNQRNRGLVLSSAAKLREASSGDVHSILKPYLLSESWTALRRATERSVPDSNLDVMVQLVQVGRNPRTISDRAKFTRITFRSKDDLIRMFSPDRKESSSKLPQNATESMPRSASMSVAMSNQATKMAGETNSITDGPTSVVEDVDYVGDEDDDHMEEAIEDEMSNEAPVHDATVPLSGRQIVAGRIILRFFRLLLDRKIRAIQFIERRYKAILTRRLELERPGMRGTRARFRKACIDVDLKRNKIWPSARHRVEFLGVIPDLLTCLDALQILLQTNNKRAKEQLMKSNVEQIDYEEVDLRMAEANATKKRFEQLKEKMKETSNWHARRTSEDLRKVVEQIIALFDELKVGGEERERCIEIRGFIRERKPLPYQRQPRPALNITDLDDMYYDDWDYGNEYM